MMIGLPAMVYPSGSKLSRFERLPSWKIQTRAPKLAVIESRVMITALIGMTTRPEQQEQDQAAGEQRQPDGVRRTLGLRDRKSWPLAALPPTWVVMPVPGVVARIDRDEVGRVGPRRRQRADGVEPDRRAADVLRQRARRCLADAGRPGRAYSAATCSGVRQRPGRRDRGW